MIRPLSGLVLLSILSAAAARPARADAPAPSDADKAKQLLQTIEQSSDPDARLAAAKDLTAIGARVEDQLAAYVARPHTSTPDDRRKVLAKIHAAVPDKSGNFHAPPRDEDKKNVDDKVDWLPDLVKLDPATPGAAEVIGDVAALRAIAAAKDPKAARVILDAAFADDTMIYRDECGRLVRAMQPFSIPALMVDSQAKSESRRRDARDQHERLDRPEPCLL
jgi:hypothetical protein